VLPKCCALAGYSAHRCVIVVHMLPWEARLIIGEVKPAMEQCKLSIRDAERWPSPV